MNSAIRTLGRMCSFSFLALAAALGQSTFQSDPVPAAKGPAYNLNIGYTSLMMKIPSAKTVDLRGVDLGASMDFKQRWSMAVDANFAHEAKLLGTPHQGYVASLHGGPVFYLLEQRNMGAFLHALAGAAMVDAVVPQGPYAYRYGFVTRPSYALGGGVEQGIPGPFALRITADYLRTSFFNDTGAIVPQNNLRLTASLVFSTRRRAAARTH